MLCVFFIIIIYDDHIVCAPNNGARNNNDDNFFYRCLELIRLPSVPPSTARVFTYKIYNNNNNIISVRGIDFISNPKRIREINYLSRRLFDWRGYLHIFIRLYVHMPVHKGIRGFVTLFVDAKTICSAEDDDSNLSFDTIHGYRPSGLQTILNIDPRVSK